MAVKYSKFKMPESIRCEKGKNEEEEARFIAEPFEPGFAHTLGNTYRRVLLASLEAPAIVSVRIEGVLHEYGPIAGVIEDMTDVVLQIKSALLRKLPSGDEVNSHDTKIVSSMLEISQEQLDQNKGQYVVTLKDVMTSSEFEVINPDLPLFTVTQPLKRQVTLQIAFGRGYVPSERQVLPNKVENEIVIDACFSPVRLVNYFAENTRIGQDTDFDRLVLEVLTDGRITPTEAVAFATQIIRQHLEVFNNISAEDLVFEEEGMSGQSEDDSLMAKLVLRIDEIELSVRSTNCLSGAQINTIGELVIIPERHMLNFRNFGKKSLQEIKDKLEEMGLHLGMDLSYLGLTKENVREKIDEYLQNNSAANAPTTSTEN